MKTLLHNTRGSKTGSALVTVMGVVMLIAVVGAGMVSLGRQQIHSARRMRDYAKAPTAC
jgi:type II secretory pathway component PulK